MAGNFTYYQYDSSGQRVRKVTDMYAYQRHEWIYIGGYEVYKKTDAVSGATLLERQTLKVMDDTACVAIIDTSDDAGTVTQNLRYQFSNHLGTATLELDDHADIISYEEYYPFGNTSFQGGQECGHGERDATAHGGTKTEPESQLRRFNINERKTRFVVYFNRSESE